MKILIVLALAIISGILYRRGGTSKGTLWRDIGCPIIFLVSWVVLFGFQLSIWWAYLLVFGLSWGAISAYWGQDEKPWGYWAHGLGLSLACLPLAIVTGYWGAFGIHTLLLTAGICVWSQFTLWDILEEVGRGIIYILTAFIFLLQF